MFYHASWFQMEEASTVNEGSPTKKPNVQEYITPIAVIVITVHDVIIRLAP